MQDKKILIVASGHLGATVKAAESLKSHLGGADVFDTRDKECALDFSSYDVFVFGTNIRMFMLNARFKKWARRLKKFYAGKAVYGYVVAANGDSADKWIAKAASKLKAAKQVVYLGGELDSANADKFAKSVIDSVRADHLAKGKPLPALNEQAIAALAQYILGN